MAALWRIHALFKPFIVWPPLGFPLLELKTGWEDMKAEAASGLGVRSNTGTCSPATGSCTKELG